MANNKKGENKMPTNTRKLRGKILEKGYTYQDIAKRLNISYQSFSNKVNNKTEFKASEILIICDMLDIADKDGYFFCEINSQNG